MFSGARGVDLVVKPFLTVKGEESAEFCERGSRFIGYVRQVSTQSEAEKYLDFIKSQHKTARHNVYAYRLRCGSVKFSEDGEPQGTAGSRVLSYLDRLGLENVVLVVTRYFGGVFLGTGGLSRAYLRAAKMAVEACGITQMVPCIVAKIYTDYPCFERIRKVIERFRLRVSDFTYTNFVESTVYIDCERYNEFESIVNQISAGSIKIIVEKVDYCCVELKD